MGISKWNAGIIRPVPVAPTGPYADSSAPGVWTLDQQAYWQKQGLWPTQGNVNPDVFIENLFSTYLYTGTGAAQTITNGIDLAGKGGLTWIKGRSGATNHALYDTVRGATFDLVSNSTAAQTTQATGLTAFSSTGFSIGALAKLNTNAATYVSWTFREQPKFFDIVTFTAGSNTNRRVSHSLGSTPGFIVIKAIDGITDWFAYHRSLGRAYYISLNLTDAAATIDPNTWGSSNPTSTDFGVNEQLLCTATKTYVAYLFAHDAGGFGLTGTDNVISCGTFTTNGSGIATINLGYEPQFVLYKASSAIQNWEVYDTMRGITASAGTAARLAPNLPDAEADFTNGRTTINATGFSVNNLTSTTYIYIAIRRGPMAVPTLGTSVFTPTAPANGTGAATSISGLNFSPDLMINLGLSSGIGKSVFDRLRGRYLQLLTDETGAEVSRTDTVTGFDLQNGVLIGNGASGYVNNASYSYNNLLFRRAPGFFDEVCYTGTGSATTQAHNLTVVPELMIIKLRSAAGGSWPVYHVFLGPSSGPSLTYTNAAYWGGSSNLNSTTPTNSVFTVGTDTETNDSSKTYVAYLFATCAGVSKVGNYTGTGALQTVACGFTSGARLVLIKRTDSTGAWYVWDSARGITSGNDPYTLLNSTAAEVTNTNYVDTDTTGFKVTAAAPAALNAVGGNYIFLAIA